MSLPMIAAALLETTFVVDDDDDDDGGGGGGDRPVLGTCSESQCVLGCFVGR